MSQPPAQNQFLSDLNKLVQEKWTTPKDPMTQSEYLTHVKTMCEKAARLGYTYMRDDAVVFRNLDQIIRFSGYLREFGLKHEIEYDQSHYVPGEEKLPRFNFILIWGEYADVLREVFLQMRIPSTRKTK